MTLIDKVLSKEMELTRFAKQLGDAVLVSRKQLHRN